MKLNTTDEIWEYTYNKLIFLNYEKSKIINVSDIDAEVITFDKFVDKLVKCIETEKINIEEDFTDEYIYDFCMENDYRFLD